MSLYGKKKGDTLFSEKAPEVSSVSGGPGFIERFGKTVGKSYERFNESQREKRNREATPEYWKEKSELEKQRGKYERFKQQREKLTRPKFPNFAEAFGRSDNPFSERPFSERPAPRHRPVKRMVESSRNRRRNDSIFF
jgi:hypothetical protein